MRVGVIDLLVDEVPSRLWLDTAYRGVFKKQYAGIVPQAVSVWCRQLGHQVCYATYYGQRDPGELLPADLDVVFVSAYTQASGLAYALARLYRARGARTVIGGPHARSFPHDSLRFFDLAVLDCDRTLVQDIVQGQFDPGSVVSSGRRLTDLPGVEERMPEIRAAFFARGRPVASTTVPLLTSVGCPYRCDFCIDWDNPYAVLPRDRLAADLQYLAHSWPQVMVSYHDPNFAVRFDEVVSVMEEVPAHRCNPYIMETSLSVLKGERLRRLRATNCIYVAPGIESWADYSQKAGLGRSAGPVKLERLVEHFEELHEHGFGLQANFIFGTTGDTGREPVTLTKDFIRRLPFVWPTVNVPTPFGGTPLYDAVVAENRLLRSMPLTFYYTPYLVTRLAQYEPADYYGQLAEIYAGIVSTSMLGRRLMSKATWGMRTLHALRTFGMRQDVATFSRIRRMLVNEPDFRAFHEGRSERLPAFYHREFERKLGRYAELIGPRERSPMLEPAGVGTARMRESMTGPGHPDVAPAQFPT